jgi:hypothetical protein
MANRYWVGGTGTWNPASTSWSTTSGGSPGAAAPLATDNAIFDANSGGGTVTVQDGSGGSGNSPECASLTCTGFTGAIDSSAQPLQVNGNVTLSSGGTYTALYLIINNVCTLTSVGKPIAYLFIGNNTGNANLTLGDDLYCGVAGDFGSIGFSDGTFNANNKNVSCSGFVSFDTGYTRTLNMGTGTWTLFGGTNDSGWMSAGYDDVINMTINCNTSTINFTPPASSLVTFSSHNKTYYNLNMGGAGSTLWFQSYVTNIFNTISTSAQPCTLTFREGRTYTVTNFNVSGTAGNLVTLQSVTAGTRFSLSKASGTVSVDYLSIKDSNATGGANWYAGTNSTNVSNNLGWTFTAPPGPGPGPSVAFTPVVMFF